MTAGLAATLAAVFDLFPTPSPLATPRHRTLTNSANFFGTHVNNLCGGSIVSLRTVRRPRGLVKPMSPDRRRAAMFCSRQRLPSDALYRTHPTRGASESTVRRLTARHSSIRQALLVLLAGRVDATERDPAGTVDPATGQATAAGGPKRPPSIVQSLSSPRPHRCSFA